MSTSDRFPYLTATVLDQELLDNSHDNLACQLELICEIDSPIGIIYASDRNKYVGEKFYEALLALPTVNRTIGEWLSGQLEFSTVDINLSNVDGRFNSILPAGTSFAGFIGSTIEIKIGLRDVASTYKTVFKGKVTDVGGWGRTVKELKLTARDDFDKLNVTFPPTVFTQTTFGVNIEKEIEGQAIPVIYGDFTTAITDNGASVPGYVTNGADGNVVGGARNNVKLYIADHALTFFDSTQVYIVKGSEFFLFAGADIVNISGNLNSFEVVQNGASTIDGGPYQFDLGDTFFVKVKGKDLGAYDDNLVEIAKDILITYGGATLGDFDTTWDTYRDKAAPAQSSISTFKARLWRQDPETAITVALSLLEQVRLEAFINRDLKLSINSLHFEDFVPDPSFLTRNWDVVKDSFSPQIDKTSNNFNRAKGFYNFLPDRNDSVYNTAVFRNDAAVTQQKKEISKKIEFPNLYESQTVDYQVIEMIRLGSAQLEIIEVDFTWRSLLLDIGDFVKLNVQIQSTVYENVPCMIRDIGYNPAGVRIPTRLFSFQMTPFPGYVPGYIGTVGGYAATIIQEP